MFQGTLVFMLVCIVEISCCMKSRDDYLAFVSDVAFCRLFWGMWKEEVDLRRNGSFQVNSEWSPPDAPCEEESTTLVTKCTSVYFTLLLQCMSLISMGIKYLSLFLVEHILKLKLLDMFLAGLSHLCQTLVFKLCMLRLLKLFAGMFEDELL